MCAYAFLAFRCSLTHSDVSFILLALPLKKGCLQLT